MVAEDEKPVAETSIVNSAIIAKAVSSNVDSTVQ